MNYETAFNKIKDKLSVCDFNDNDNSWAIQVNLTNKDCGGILYIQNKEGELLCEPYDYRDNNATVYLTVNDMLKLIDKKLTLEEGLSTNKVAIDGSVPIFSGLLESLTPIQDDNCITNTSQKKCRKKASDDILFDAEIEAF